MSAARRAGLVRLLSAYQPSAPAEAHFRKRMLELARGNADPFVARRFDPGHFTASAFVLSPDATQLLLVLHGKLGLWLQPGGHVDPGDRSIRAAARREVREETGIELAPSRGIAERGIFDLDIHAIPARQADPAHEHFDVRFLFRAAGGALEARSDAKAARWVPLPAVHTMQSDASVMRAVEKILRRSTAP